MILIPIGGVLLLAVGVAGDSAEDVGVCLLSQGEDDSRHGVGNGELGRIVFLRAPSLVAILGLNTSCSCRYRSAREASDGGGGGGDAAAAVSRTVSGTMKTDVGNSAFYSKVSKQRRVAYSDTSHAESLFSPVRARRKIGSGWTDSACTTNAHRSG